MAGMGESVLEVSGLTRTFGDHVAVSALSFSVGQGELVGLLGPNGSGKTTTLHLLVGLLDPTSGVVSINGRPPSENTSRRGMGFIPDDLALPHALTGVEYLALHDGLRSVDSSELTDELVELFGLGAHLRRPVGDYSHGMKRKLQFIAGVAHRPKVVILDEPHRGLDPEASGVLLRLLDLLRLRGTAVLVATHDLRRAGRECDRVVVLHEGVRLAYDTPKVVCEHAGANDLEEAFLRMTGLEGRLADARCRLDAVLGVA